VNENWEIQRAIWDDHRLEPTEKLIALRLVWHRNANSGRCDPSQSRLARDVGVSIATVKRAILSLERKGVLARKRGQRSCLYAFSREWFFNGLSLTHERSDSSPMSYQGPFWQEELRELEKAKMDARGARGRE